MVAIFYFYFFVWWGEGLGVSYARCDVRSAKNLETEPSHCKPDFAQHLSHHL